MVTMRQCVGQKGKVEAILQFVLEILALIHSRSPLQSPSSSLLTHLHHPALVPISVGGAFDLNSFFLFFFGAPASQQ